MPALRFWAKKNKNNKNKQKKGRNTTDHTASMVGLLINSEL